MRISYAIVFVTDMKRSIAFYRDALGMPMRFESPEWTEFATEGATLALHRAEKPNPDDHDPGAEFAGRCRPGLRVPDLNAFHERMIAQKVTCLKPPAENFGTRLAQYADPDGLPISVSEDPKGRK